VEYKTFIADANEFRKKLGEKTFWALSEEKQDEWFKGLGWSFAMLKAETEEQNRLAGVIFQGIIEEFARRRAYMFLHPLREKL
jgi:predicted nucleic acid-binding OB-fold protein